MVEIHDRWTKCLKHKCYATKRGEVLKILAECWLGMLEGYTTMTCQNNLYAAKMVCEWGGKDDHLNVLGSQGNVC